MHPSLRYGALALAVTLAACTASTGSTEGKPDASTPDAGVQREAHLAKLESYIVGAFDDFAQWTDEGGYANASVKKVERHVCLMPGRNTSPDTLWVYVEQIEILNTGTRDAYMTRVNEIKMVDGHPVARIFKFADTSPFATNPYGFNGPREGCDRLDELADTTDDDLVYRDGCDVTYTENGDEFDAASPDKTCTFPGGYIVMNAKIFPDGMDSKDEAYVNGAPAGEPTYQFRRMANQN